MYIFCLPGPNRTLINKLEVEKRRFFLIISFHALNSFVSISSGKYQCFYQDWEKKK